MTNIRNIYQFFRKNIYSIHQAIFRLLVIKSLSLIERFIENFKLVIVDSIPLSFSLVSSVQESVALLQFDSIIWLVHESLYLAHDLAYCKSTLINLVDYPSGSVSVESSKKGAFVLTRALEKAALICKDIHLEGSERQ